MLRNNLLVHSYLSKMTKMNIHHYTNASTLPLILDSKKIRFTRADLLDDGSEMPFRTAYLNPQQYFISSWTHADRELSGQWYRYGDHDRGVRLTLPDSPFTYYHLKDDISASDESGSFGIMLNGIDAPFSLETMLGKGFVLIPYLEMDKYFGGFVNYVSDPALQASNLYSTDEDGTHISLPGHLGRIKSKFWSDQEEYRFVLVAYQGPDLKRSEVTEVYDRELLSRYQAGQTVIPAQIQHIDLPLAEDMLSQLIVTLGPRISSENREMVYQAMCKFSPSGIVRESEMNIRS
ncbi:Uncharacterised protein [Yersinia similis]|uniref:DUF2971 domain-containing protein n=3 Tax=Yersinia TaxID=629 RepID=A0A0T9RQB7_9GAMM|nr:Uncharacterised protein [Yersinia similis]